MRAKFVSIVSSMVLAATAFAGTQKIDVPAGDLIAALQSLARQADVDLVYQDEQIKGLRTAGVSGNLSPQEALVKLLEGTSLRIRTDETSGAILITPAARTSDADALPATDSGNSLRLVRNNDANTAAQQGQRSSESKAAAEQTEAADAKGIPEVLVKGSKILNTDIKRSRDDTQPYVIFDRGTIERSGAVNLGDFLKQRLPQNTRSSSLSQTNSGNGNQSIISMRGLSFNETLILIDGHRAVPPTIQGVPSQADMNGIAMSAVERIEILPTTAGGIYGGSATGGVINIIMRRDYTGIETKVTYENSFASDTTQRKIDMSAGFTLEGGKTTVLMAGSYFDANDFFIGERDYMRDGRLRILANNPGYYLNGTVPPLGYTTNIRSATNNSNGTVQNLTLDNGTALNSPIAFVPVGYAGRVAAGDNGAAFLATAGRYNFDLANTAQGPGATAAGSGALRSQNNTPKVKSFSTTIRRPLGSRLQAFLDLSASDNESLYASNSANGEYTIAGSAPNNPFTQTIRVRAPISASDSYVQSSNRQRRAMAGLIMQLPRNWTAETDYTWDRSRSFLRSASNVSTTLTTPINAGTIDLLRDLNAFPVDLAASVELARKPTPYYATFKDAVLRASGPIAQLPGGPINVATLIERTDLDISEARLIGPPTSVFPARSQVVNSAYFETKMPLIGAGNAKRGARELELQLAGRWDQYRINAVTGSYTEGANTPVLQNSRELTSINPTVGLRYVPHASWILRASYGTGFLPPDLSQLAPIIPSGATVAVNDPRRGGASASPINAGGGSPDLDPEKSESFSAGAVFSPQSLPGLRLSLDYVNIEKSDAISIFAAQVIVDNEALFPNRVTRAAVAPGDAFGVGVITSVDTTRLNISKVKIEAWDFAADYSWDSAFGAFTAYTIGTRQTHYKTQLLTTVPFVENVGITANFPSKLKVNAGLDWERKGWMGGWAANYISSYRASNDPVTLANQGGDGTVAAQIYNDVYAGYRTQAGGSWLSNLEARFGVKNVLNKKAPFDAGNTSNLYYSFYGDPHEASYYLSIKKSY